MAPAIDPLSINQVVNAAYARWAAALGVSANTLKIALNLSFLVTDLGGSTLGELDGHLVRLDDNAAGNGWYVDTTPMSNGEYRRNKGSLSVLSGPASQGIDLLTTVMHEIGHALGLSDNTTPTSIMDDTLGLGTRRLPSKLPHVLDLLQHAHN